MTSPKARPTARERVLVEVIKELWGAYRKQVVSAEKERVIAEKKNALLHQVLHEWGRTIAGWTPHAKGPEQLAKLNRLSRALAHRRQDASRPLIEDRISAGKSYQQIANLLGWSKSDVARSAKRWGLKPRGKRPRQKAETIG